jgi:mRNA interferase HigB
VRIIKTATLDGFAKIQPTAAAGLTHWETIARAAEWKNLVQTRESFPHADQVTVRSGRTVTVFNIKKNDYRLITAIHYNTRKVFILLFLTHAEYDKDKWKDTL